MCLDIHPKVVIRTSSCIGWRTWIGTICHRGSWSVWVMNLTLSVWFWIWLSWWINYRQEEWITLTGWDHLTYWRSALSDMVARTHRIHFNRQHPIEWRSTVTQWQPWMDRLHSPIDRLVWLHYIKEHPILALCLLSSIINDGFVTVLVRFGDILSLQDTDDTWGSCFLFFLKDRVLINE